MARSWRRIAGKFLQARKAHVSLCATEAEREAVYRLRHRIFNEEQDLDFPSDHGALREPWDAASFHLQAVLEGRLVGSLSFHRLSDAHHTDGFHAFYGTAELSPEASARTVIAGQLVIDASVRGQGIAVALCWNLYQHTLESGFTTARMSCNPRMTSYYTPFGWYHVRSGLHPRLGFECDVLRHDLHRFGPMLRHASPLAFQLLRWRLRGSPLTRPKAPPRTSPVSARRQHLG